MDIMTFILALAQARKFAGEIPKGDAATIEIGTIEYGEELTVTNSGTSSNAILNFTFPGEARYS